MSVSIRGGLFGFLARLGRPPAADSDADLLDRFVRDADEVAFTGIVRRHGPMVLAVCRRRLGHDADAEDAFQAVFLALARSAATIGRRESLPGWLYRVAYLVSLKAAGRRARHPVAALPKAEVPMTDPPTTAAEADDLKAVLDSELASLPDKFRAVVVLCLVEGRTNAEAAAVLGVPVGTVDSRLNTARARLRARLTRRGVAMTAGVTLDQLFGGWVRAADGPAFQELVSGTVRAVLAEAAGPGAGAVSPAVADLARGVTTMTTLKFRLLAALGVALGLLGGAGAGIYLAFADEPAQPAKTADPKGGVPMVAAKPEAKSDPEATEPIAAQGDVKGTAAALDKKFGEKVDGVPMGQLLDQIEDITGLVVRVDVAAFRRIGAIGPVGIEGEITADHFLQTLYEAKTVLPRRVDKMPVRDVLTDALAQSRTYPATFQVRGSQLVIVPAYTPPGRPGANPLDPGEDDIPMVDMKVLHEQIYGGVVSVSADRKPLADILADLRKQTGANIVIDPRCEAAEKKATVTIALSDVRLYDALRVIADMAELKMVYAGNIYYVTTPANAKTFQPPTPRPPMP
jgi:RNA polymerase sigma factor (sigma-70 family)